MEGLPNNLDAEIQILGRMIRIGERAHEIAVKLKAEQFYAIRHQLIFEALAKVCEHGNPSTPAICDALTRAGQIEHVGGEVYLMELASSVVSMVGWESDAALILDAYKRRQIIALGRWALNEAEEAEDAESLLSATVERITGIVNGQGGARSGYAHAAAGLDSVLSTEMPRECPTGIDWLDKLYTPRPGNYVVLGGFSGGGKTALAAGIGASVGERENVLIASLEMSADEIIERIIPWTTKKIEISRIRGRNLQEFERVEARSQIVRRGIHITEAQTIHEIEQSARALKISRGGLGAVIIDYLQLLEGGKKRGGESNRAQEVAAISRHCKLMARRLDCVVYALTQLNNEASREGTPKLHHIKESGGIRQDADAILMIYHPDSEELAQAKKVIMNLKSAQRNIEQDHMLGRAKIVSSKRVLDLQKGRSAAESSTELMFEGPYTRFRKAEGAEWSVKL